MFVPRSVAKSKTKRPKSVAQDASSTSTARLAPTNAPGPSSGFQLFSQPTEKEIKARKEFAALIELSLTDYSLWKTPELRVVAETQVEGWMSLAALLRHSPYLMNVEDNENTIVQALRTYGKGHIEVQMSLAAHSTASGNQYSLRRKDWATFKEIGLRNMSQNDWDERTLYVENIPPQYWKTTHGLVRFLEYLLSSEGLPLVVQDVAFPPKEGSSSYDTRCRGFAFIVCQSIDTAKNAKEKWSWEGMLDRDSEPSEETIFGRVEGDDLPEMKEMAKTCGLRVIDLERWTSFRDEYLRYHEESVNANKKSRIPPPSEAKQSSLENLAPIPETTVTTKRKAPMSRQTEPQIPETPGEAVANFPQGCLVFVQNIHPQTNKTTLRKLLSQAFDCGDGDDIDYVDFNKGLEDCYVRLSHPSLAAGMARYFANNIISQAEPLDETGVASYPDARSIAIEVVTGTREALYWAKVPEKIRFAAIERLGSSIDSRKRQKRYQ